MLLRADTFSALPPRRRHAIVIRVGEKRILHGALRLAEIAKAVGGAAAQEDGSGKKRKNADTGAASAKKARR
jgi:hypothetical protein